MPSTDITTCASMHCPKRWRCAEHYSNVPVDATEVYFFAQKYQSHHDPYRPELGGCEWFREIKEKGE